MDQQELSRWRWPLALVMVALIIAMSVFLIYRETLRAAASAGHAATDVVAEVADSAIAVAESFQSGTITTTFLAAIPEVASAGGGRLEVASADVTETLERSDERKVLWDMFSLGKTTVEIRVPVTYRYHLLLDDAWELEISGQSCVVHAPALRPTLPPGIHTEGMEKRTAEDWLRFDALDQLADLERGLTPALELYARDERHMDLVREKARMTVTRFVRDWLLAEDQWRTDGFRSVTVIFADEDPGALVDLPSLALRE
jgi:hypothetical protein